MSQTENSEDLELFHYGVKGMQWGKRRPVGSDGLVKGTAKKVGSKLARAKANDNDDTIKIHQQYRDKSGGKVMNALSFADRKILGQKRFEKWHNMQIDILQEQNDRIRSGKTTTIDKLDIAMSTPLYQIIKA